MHYSSKINGLVLSYYWSSYLIVRAILKIIIRIRAYRQMVLKSVGQPRTLKILYQMRRSFSHPLCAHLFA